MAIGVAMLMLSLGLPKMAILLPIHEVAIVDVGVEMMSAFAAVALS